VDDGDGDLFGNLLSVGADRQGGQTVDGDPVRQGTGGPPLVTFGQGRAFVQPEEVWFVVGGAVVDKDDDVVHQARQLGGHKVQGVGDGLLELLG